MGGQTAKRTVLHCFYILKKKSKVVFVNYKYSAAS